MIVSVHFLAKSENYQLKKQNTFEFKQTPAAKFFIMTPGAAPHVFQKVWGSSFRNLMGQIDLRVDPPRDRLTESGDPVVLGKPKILIGIPDAAPHVFLKI